MIFRQGMNWVVKDAAGKNTLGTHPTEAQAKRQMQAIEAMKPKSKYVSAGETLKSLIDEPKTDKASNE